MNWILFSALFFILWWVTLFAVLPFGLRTQDDESDVTLGTVSSAPRGPHMLRAVLWTTVVTIVIMALLYGLIVGLGVSPDSFPQIIPDFSS